MAQTIADMLRLHARYRPRQQAIVWRDGAIDYRTLDGIVDALCLRLTAAGIGIGDLVGLSLADDARHVAALLAVIRLGAVILPLDRRWSMAERRGVAERFGAGSVLTDEEDGPAGWVFLGATLPPPSSSPYAAPVVAADAPMVLSLSSGTTGLPKGPRLSHRQLISRFMVYWIDIGLGARDRFVLATPLFFGGGRAFALAMIYAGGTICLLPPPFGSGELVDFVARMRGTAMFLVPTQLRRLLADHTESGLAFPDLRVLISSGSALYQNEAITVRKTLSPNLYQYYASTEAGGVSLLTPEGFEHHPGAVGRPCFGVDVEVVGADERPVAADVVGRLRYRSPASPDGYHVGDTTGAFDDGWFYPGDLARFDADGFLYLQGRAKDMIIRGGVNIYPADIEQALLDLPQVAEAAVTAMPSPEFGEEIAAFVVRAGDIDAAAITAACAGRLARYKVPKVIVFVDSLPKNSAGKVLKADLAARFGPSPQEIVR